MRNEINILKKVDHPNMFKLYEIFEDSDRYYLVTELCKGGELFDEICDQGKFSEKDAAAIIKQILQAIAYCHEQNVVHRDVKPENLMIDKEQNNILKLIDFGTAIEFDVDPPVLLKDIHGTSYYVAPEVLNYQGYNERCDVWSIGVILYILLTGIPPFDGDDDAQICEQVKIGKPSYSQPIWENISSDAKDLL